MDPEVEALRRLGLGTYAARAYLALVRLGPASAQEVADTASVPRTRVYATLDDLVRRSWADVEPGRPKTYRARSPAACFAREEARLADLLGSVLPALESSFHERGAAFAGPLWVLKGEVELAERTRRIVSAAKRSVLVLAPFRVPAIDDDLPKLLAAATRRGVRVRALVRDKASPLARKLARAGVDVRRGDVPIRYLVADANQALVTIPMPLPHGIVEYRTLWNPSTALVGELAGALDAMLDAAPRA